MQFRNYVTAAEPHQAFRCPSMAGARTCERARLGLVVLMSVGVGLAVIVSTYYVDNVKLLVGLVGGLAFIFLTMRWPEFGILCYVSLLSGLVSLTSLPLLHLGSVSLHISDAMLLFLMSLVFLRVTTQPGFVLYGSPLMLPLLLFIGAFLFSAVNAIFLQGVNTNVVLRTVRVLVLWIAFIPTLQLVRDERALRRLLIGLLMLTGILLIGVLFPNRLATFLGRRGDRGEDRSAGVFGFYAHILRGRYGTVLHDPGHCGITRHDQEGKPALANWPAGPLALLGFQDFLPPILVDALCHCVLLLGFLSSRERMRLLKRYGTGDNGRCAPSHRADGCPAHSGRAQVYARDGPGGVISTEPTQAGRQSAMAGDRDSLRAAADQSPSSAWTWSWQRLPPSHGT